VLISIFDSGCMFVTMQELLTFVAVRLFLPKGSSRLPRAVANALYQIIAMVAQQFEGYIFTVNIDEVWSCGACGSYVRTDQSFAVFRTDQSFSVFLTVRDRASHNLSVLYSELCAWACQQCVLYCVNTAYSHLPSLDAEALNVSCYMPHALQRRRSQLQHCRHAL